MAAITPGKRAPAFSLPNQDGEQIKLADYKGEQLVVLYFYPRDDTPGCTTEAIDFSKALPRLKRLGAVVLGVSADGAESHRKFRKKHKLKVELLTDADHKVMEKYGAWGEKVLYGKKSLGVIRSTVLIGQDGKVVRHWPKVRVKGHVDEVLEAVREAAAG